MRIEIPFVGQDYANRSSNVNDQRTVNLYPRTQKMGAKSPVVLYSTPGAVLRGTAGTGPWRSDLVEFGGDLYGISGDTLYKINSSLSASSIGTLSTSGGRCVLAAGRTYLMIVDGSNGYSYDGSTFSTISDGDFPSNPSHCTYLDGFFFANDSGSDQFYKSASEDPTSWNALAFASAESSPDDILAFDATYKDLYFVGSKTTEVWYNNQNPDFPFAPYPNGTMDIGIQAKYSLAKSAAGLFWLATTSEGDISVVSNGQVISDDIAWDLEQFTTTSDATGFSYRQNGQTKYQISFPTEDKTFEYIIEEQKWIERKYNGIGRYLAAGHGYIENQHVIVDYSNGNYYELDFSTFTDNSEEIERIRRAPVIDSNHDRLIFHELIVEFEAGVGLITGQGSDPQAMLRYSDDGGHTWSNEIWRSIGAIGQYGYRSRWTRLGISRNRIFEIKVTDPVDVTIIAAYARVTKCAN